MGQSERARRQARRSGVDPVTGSGELVRAAQAGDHLAFTRLLEETDGRMQRLAFRLLGSAAAMDDALQDAYLKAYRKLDTYSGDAAFSTWLYAIVYRTCLDHLRARSRRHEVELAEVPDVASGAADHTQRSADADAIARALATLPPDQAAVVILVDGEGLSYGEAATVLDVREGTVASRLHRAHVTLRSHLHETIEEGTAP